MTNSEQIKEAPAEDDGQKKATAAEAAERLAAAFATIAEFSDYLPPDLYNCLADAIQEIYDAAEWETEPTIMRLVWPHVLLLGGVVKAPDPE
jgi:hypothetical protein